MSLAILLSEHASTLSAPDACAKPSPCGSGLGLHVGRVWGLRRSRGRRCQVWELCRRRGARRLTPTIASCAASASNLFGAVTTAGHSPLRAPRWRHHSLRSC